jgi:hypothetical protein
VKAVRKGRWKKVKEEACTRRAFAQTMTSAQAIAAFRVQAS